MKVRQGLGSSRPQKPINEQRFSCYQGRTPRYYHLIISILRKLVFTF